LRWALQPGRSINSARCSPGLWRKTGWRRPMKIPSYALLLAALIVLVALTFIASLLVGPSDLGIIDSLQGFFSPEPSLAWLVMHEIRLPRALLGLMIGATLGLSGAVLQGFLRN